MKISLDRVENCRNEIIQWGKKNSFCCTKYKILFRKNIWNDISIVNEIAFKVLQLF